MSDKNKGGRPRKYSSEQVEVAIARVEDRGKPTTGASVKEVLHNEFGVSAGIDVTILDAEVQRLRQVRAEERARELSAMLPTSTREAASEVGTEVTRAVTAVLAEQFYQLNKESRAREAELEADLRVFRRRVRELEAQIAVRDTSYATLETNNHDLEEQAKMKDAEISKLSAQITQLARDGDLEGRFVEIVKGFIAGNIQATCADASDPST